MTRRCRSSPSASGCSVPSSPSWVPRSRSSTSSARMVPATQSCLFSSPLGVSVCIDSRPNQFTNFEWNQVGYNNKSFSTILPGKLMARWLPERQFNLFGWRFSFNPGPFNVKEHVIIAVAASTGGTSAYATDILTIQDLFYGQRIGPLGGIMLLITSQSLGYALAGICQKYLVRPAAMVSIPAPLNPLDTVTFPALISLRPSLRSGPVTSSPSHFTTRSTATRAPPASSPNNPTLNKLGAAANGLGMLDFSLDWNAISSMQHFHRFQKIACSSFGPMYTPFWAQMNYFAGKHRLLKLGCVAVVQISNMTIHPFSGIIFQVWILIPILYFNNVCSLYPNSDIWHFVIAAITKPASSIHKPVPWIRTYMTSTPLSASPSPLPVSTIDPRYLPAYFFSLAAYASTITHVGLFYGREIWNRFMASRSEENDDIHTKLMRIYPEVPNWCSNVKIIPPSNYAATIFVVMMSISVALCYLLPIHLPWWALVSFNCKQLMYGVIAILMAIIMILPIGVITAISNNQVGLNVVTELVCGYMLPGRPLANVTFKTYGYMAMYQGLLFVSDLKLGHYMKIPPKIMFLAQVYGTVVGCILNYFVMIMIIDAKRPFLDGTEIDPAGQWTGQSAQIFNTASIIWGLIGPARMFGPGSQYEAIMWSFLVGFVMPVPVYLLHRKFPNFGFDSWNVSIFALGAATFPGPYGNVIISGFIMSVISMHYLYRYKQHWWSKYNYVLSAAFDSATQIQTMILFFAMQSIGVSFQIFPSRRCYDHVFGNKNKQMYSHCTAYLNTSTPANHSGQFPNMVGQR
ncbi:OPT oligopeptide transporter protein-domain-containing protein [Jimgerdemannia flammicorona]|uniref:OPT oligopeptide transporter protein-domain-containing protein n=1 Tax=Jimgerdemannia flammicorona TaxID=994334 RepID=A0A433CW25_9FUNG|nr:OPT oligopeptide transporter protein-domain-containing protein [Jimgerdemannia flammicorona]